ncbi:MAG: prepilin-type N-terminal cleavage/methylation domain-containing protein [Candidatus Omnitrophota bacterium]
MIKRNLNKSQGFTVIEIIIAAAIVSIVILGTYSLLLGQQMGYLDQQRMLHLQQQMRTALNVINKNIRMAGFDPTGKNETTPNTFGFQSIQSNTVSFTYDVDSDGVLDTNERYIFRVNANILQYSNDNGTNWHNLTWQSSVAQVEATNLTFTYYDENGTITAVAADVRGVQVALTERVKLSSPGYNSKTLTTKIKVRNYD